QKFGRGLFFLDFIIYLSFLSALTALCFVVPNIFTARLDEYGCPLPVGSNTSVYYDQDGNIILTGNYVFDVTFVLQLYIAVYVVINVIREFFELIQTGYNYFMEISNWVDWAMYSTALYFIFPPGHSPCVGQWKSGSFAIFCAWLDLILYFRRISMFGVYVVMFFKVLKSFVKIVILFLMFVIAFSFALHMMYFDMDEFSTFWRSLVKVCVMSVGELDYGDLFYGREHKEGFIANPLSTPLYILFLFLMPILLMNLLLGVAVGDIDEVQKRATLEKIEMEVNMLEQMEDSMPTWLQRRLYTPQLTYEPYSTSCSSKVKKCFSRRNVDLEKRERIMQEAGGVNAESLQENIEEFRSSVVERQKLMTQMMELNNSVLMKMAEKLDVKFDEAQFRAAKDLSN
ncbi:transient receptor potential cation channel subfamily A member 1-like, partial [Saccoglossus kowalevskii]|uniref:Transient receptor potential cation channel subfamily A member 1 homolog n=1 Tax=Saccoglossus kowalevskii TaxID=10224 RepID=A0ABM0LYN9_SACKO